MSVELVYQDRDNDIRLTLKEDKTPADLTAVTRVLLEISYSLGTTATVDSDAATAGAVDWSLGNGRLHLDLGGEGLSTGNATARVITFDTTNPGGVVWGEFPVSIRA